MAPVHRSDPRLPAALQLSYLAKTMSGLFSGTSPVNAKKSGTLNKTLYGSGALLLALQSGVVAAQSVPAASNNGAASDAIEKVIVTGTRRSGLKVVDSPSPIQVLDSASLDRTGQPDLTKAIAATVPSFTVQAFGEDTAALTVAARLRGLSPNDTLVLINGKRRHNTSNLSVDPGPYQGGAAADLGFIPESAIERIEVLTDGAAAQYGTDAIAGVVNIILKKSTQGGSVSTTGGQYIDGGGRSSHISGNVGFSLTENGFVNLSAEAGYHGHSDRGGIDPRLVDADNLAEKFPGTTDLKDVPGYPYLNKTVGDAAYHNANLAVNAGLKLRGDTELYSFATYGNKTAEGIENYRLPKKFAGLAYTPDPTLPLSLQSKASPLPGTSLPNIYPNGFTPYETTDETDYALTLGIKGKFMEGWSWDLSTVYGKDKNDLGNIHTANLDLYIATGDIKTPRDFHNGSFTSSQWTHNFDMSRDFEVGLASPLSVAFGLEHRTDTYAIGAGDAASQYLAGPQAYPGFQNSDAGGHRRTNSALYIDLATSPVEDLKIDVAARAEHFSDFGGAHVGKLTARYDFSPAVGMRSTVSNGFRAPTMAEEFYSATTVSPDEADVQLPPGSKAAALIGVHGLKPEKSKNISLGLVFHPAPKMAFTMDAYQISITDRIIGSGSIYGTGSGTNSDVVTEAIKLNGTKLGSDVATTAINIFTNGLDTRTRGLEAVYSYAAKYDGMGSVDWSAAGSYNTTKVTKIHNTPAELGTVELVSENAISVLETASPKYRINLGALWKKGDWTVNLRESFYGAASEIVVVPNEAGDKTFTSRDAFHALTDLEVSNRLTKSFTLSVGANNLFNIYPTKKSRELLNAYANNGPDAYGVHQYPIFSSIGINGGYYYARLDYSF